MVQLRPDQKCDGRILKQELGIPRPSVLLNALKRLQLIDDNNMVTELGKEFINPTTKAQACRRILEMPPYNEITNGILNGQFKTRKDVENYIKALTSWSVDPVDKATSLYFYLLKHADLPQLKDHPILKSVQTLPRPGTRKGKKNKIKNASRA